MEQTAKEKFEDRYIAIRPVYIKTQRNFGDRGYRACLDELKAASEDLEQLFNEAYGSLEEYAQECFIPVNKLASEWGLPGREPIEPEWHRKHKQTFYEVIRSIKQDASESASVVSEKTRYVSIRKRHDPHNIQPADRNAAVSILTKAFQTTTPGVNYDFTGRVTDIQYDTVSIGGHGTGRYAHYMKVEAVNAQGEKIAYVVNRDDLEYRSLDNSPQKAKSLAVGDLVAVNLDAKASLELHNDIHSMRGLPCAQSLYVVVPAAFYDAEKGRMVVKGRVEEIGKKVLRHDWSERDITIIDDQGNRGTFILPGNADFDAPNVMEGQQVFGVVRDIRLQVLRPLG